MAESRRKEFFPEVTDEQWNDWKWQVKNRIETVDQLKKYLDLDPSEEEGIRNALQMLRMAITPYYKFNRQEQSTLSYPQTSGSFSLGTTQSECRLGRPVTRRQRFSRTGINSSVSGPGVILDHGSMFHVLPSLYPQTFCRTKGQCLPDRTH